MQFSTITAVVFGLFAAQALACGNPGDQCNSPGAKDCVCNSGNVVECDEASGGSSGFVWVDQGPCPSNPGGFSCVNGQCTVSKKLRFARE